MHDDTTKLPEAPHTEDALLEELKDILAEETTAEEPAPDEPAFEEAVTDEPAAAPENDEAEAPASPKGEKLTLYLMIGACLLTLGIIGLLMYWLLFLLR